MNAAVLLASLTLAVTLHADPVAPPPPPQVAPSPAERSLDIEFLVEQLPQLHVRPFTKVSQAEWERGAKQLEVEAPMLSATDFHLRLCQLVASLGDSHTRVATQIPFRPYPLRLYTFSDGVSIVAAAEPNTELLGWRLVKIGDTPYDEARASIATLFPTENESMVVMGTLAWVTLAEPLVFLGLVQDPEHARFTFADPAGVERTIELAPLSKDSPRPTFATLPKAPQADWAISYNRDRDYWFKALPDRKAVYVRYDNCRDDPERPFKAFVKDVEKALEESKAERIIVDLRSNGGGNSAIMAPLTKMIRTRGELKKKGSVVVLIGRQTFSSAQLNANELQRDCGAVLIGLPTGQKPNAFGEIRKFKLPSTGIDIQYSTKEFRTAPPGTDPESMMPDIEIGPSVADFSAGRDPVLERALDLRVGE